MSRVTATGLVAGWLLDSAVGDPRRWHPVAGFGRVAGSLERLTYRDSRLAGAIHAAALVGGPALATRAVRRALGPRGRALLLGTVTWAALGGKSLAYEAALLAQRVEHGDLDAARRGVGALVGRDSSGLDADGLCRAAVESLGDNTADAVVAPLLYGCLLGPAGVVAHRCANTLDAMIGHRDARYAQFGWAAARLDDALGWLPARLTALLAAAAAGAVDGDPREALAVWLRDGHRHPSPNAGQAEAAFAGALGVRLGGENRYGGRTEVRGPLGDGDPPTSMDVYQGVRLSRLVATAAAAVAAALCLLLGGRT